MAFMKMLIFCCCRRLWGDLNIFAGNRCVYFEGFAMLLCS